MKKTFALIATLCVSSTALADGTLITQELCQEVAGGALFVKTRQAQGASQNQVLKDLGSTLYKATPANINNRLGAFPFQIDNVELAFGAAKDIPPMEFSDLAYGACIKHLGKTTR